MQKIKIPKILPCNPCPHNATCCNLGTWLSDEEAIEINKIYEDMTYIDLESKMWRTKVKNNKCAFYNNGCIIHHEAFYPKVCKVWPYKNLFDIKNSPPRDAIICPEVKLKNHIDGV